MKAFISAVLLAVFLAVPATGASCGPFNITVIHSYGSKSGVGGSLCFELTTMPPGITTFIIYSNDIAYETMLAQLITAHSHNLPIVVQYGANGLFGEVQILTN